MAQLASCRPLRTEQSPVRDPYLLLEMQNHAFITLSVTLARLPRYQHATFLAKTLEMITDQPVLEVPALDLGESLFRLLDHAREPSRVLTMENVMIYVAHRLGEEAREQRDR